MYPPASFEVNNYYYVSPSLIFSHVVSEIPPKNNLGPGLLHIVTCVQRKQGPAAVYEY